MGFCFNAFLFLQVKMGLLDLKCPKMHWVFKTYLHMEQETSSKKRRERWQAFHSFHLTARAGIVAFYACIIPIWSSSQIHLEKFKGGSNALERFTVTEFEIMYITGTILRNMLFWIRYVFVCKRGIHGTPFWEIWLGLTKYFFIPLKLLKMVCLSKKFQIHLEILLQARLSSNFRLRRSLRG